jgi:predicted metalloprotease with PDZ domain
MAEVTVVLRTPPRDTLDLCLPVWRPGRYAVLDQSGAVRQLRARDGNGKELAVHKTDKATWRIESGASDEVIVDYRLYANNLGDRTRHVDDTHAFISPAAVLMYCPDLRAEPLRVHLDIPPSWKVATGLDADTGDERTLLAPNYDVLVDSPIEAGLQDRATFDVDGVPHEIAVWWGGKPSLDAPPARPRRFDLDRWSADFARIVRAQRDLFGELPYKRYVFLLHVSPSASGGTEHLNSTVLQSSPERLQTEDGYLNFLTLVSHEMFHTWNVKQLRPAGLKPYDYQRENYTDLLWVCEGTTTYYEYLILARAGLHKPDRILKSLGDSIDSIRRRPGALVQSPEEASFDSWVQSGRASPDSANSTVSIYESGAIASFALDLSVRGATGGAASLDTVLRDLYDRFPLSGPGYTRADLIEAARRAGFEKAPEFFARHVSGTEPVEFESMLGAVGLELTRAESKPAADAAPEPPKATLGFTVEARDGSANVSAVRSDGPAYQAGLLPGDTLVAINGDRATPASWTALVERLPLDRPARLTIFRMNVLREFSINPIEAPASPWRVKRVKNPTDDQKAAYESWLGQEWPGRTGRGATPSDSSEPKRSDSDE